VTLTVTAAQRDALYEQVIVRLSAIDSIPLAARNGEPETAERLAREHSDYLRLLLDDLGFVVGTGKGVELSSPPDLLRRALENLRDLAEQQRTEEADERREAKKSGKQNRLVRTTCQFLLGTLDAS
jgi:hypothetical protein